MGVDQAKQSRALVERAIERSRAVGMGDVG
jgi:hypothetical protein